MNGQHYGQHLQGCISCYAYVDAENEREARERAAIDADNRAERDGYAEGRGR